MAVTAPNKRALTGLVVAMLCVLAGAVIWSSRGSDGVEAADGSEWPNALALQDRVRPTTTASLGEANPLIEQSTTTTDPPIVFGGDDAYVAKSRVDEGIVEVWSEPDRGAEPAWSLAVPTEFFGPRFFEIIGDDGIDGDWLEVTVPVRPNGTTGWIPRSEVTIAPIDTRIVIDLSDRELTVFRAGEVVTTTTVAIGKDGTPTPVGSFYLRDELPWDEASVYGPFVLALSAYSESIEQINGGDAVVAIHGTQRPDLLGQQASLGCVRVENDTIRAIAEIIEPGTPVDIVA